MAEKDWRLPPFPGGKFLGVNMGTMVSVDEEPIHACIAKVIQGIGDDRASADFQERFRTALGQRAKPHPQPGPEDKCGLKSSFGQIIPQKEYWKNGTVESWVFYFVCLFPSFQYSLVPFFNKFS
jgi:hypothetical protein